MHFNDNSYSVIIKVNLSTVISFFWCARASNWRDEIRPFSFLTSNTTLSLSIDPTQLSFQQLDPTHTALSPSNHPHNSPPRSSGFWQLAMLSLCLSFHHILVMRARKNSNQMMMWCKVHHVLEKHSVFSPSPQRFLCVWQVMTIVSPIPL